jgi:hypothetical protein
MGCVQAAKGTFFLYGLQPPLHTVAASITYRRRRAPSSGLQPPLHTVAASITYGCSLHCIQAAEGTFFEQSQNIADHITKLEQIVERIEHPAHRALDEVCNGGCNRM